MYFKKLSYGSEILDMISEGLGEMFEGDFADTCAGKFSLVSMGGRAEGLECADPVATIPIAPAEIFIYLSYIFHIIFSSHLLCELIYKSIALITFVLQAFISL